VSTFCEKRFKKKLRIGANLIHIHAEYNIRSDYLSIHAGAISGQSSDIVKVQPRIDWRNLSALCVHNFTGMNENGHKNHLFSAIRNIWQLALVSHCEQSRVELIFCCQIMNNL
jgi:hypothetical protein